MAKKVQEPAISGGTKSIQPNKTKKVTSLKAKKPAPSSPKKDAINPPSLGKVKIKSISKCNVLVPHEAAASMTTPEGGKAMEKCEVKKLQKCKSKSSPGAGKTISLRKRANNNNKPKAAKPRALRSVKSEDGTLQQEETGEGVKNTGRKGKINVEVSAETGSAQTTRNGIVVPADILKSDAPKAKKKIIKIKIRKPMSHKLQKLNKLDNTRIKDTAQIKTADEPIAESLEENKIIGSQTEVNPAPILSYLSLVAKPENYKNEVKSSTNKDVRNDVLPVRSGFTWAPGTSPTYSACTLRGFCVPINGKVPVLKLGDIKNSSRCKMINSAFQPQDEAKIPENNVAKNMHDRSASFESDFFNPAAENMSPSCKEKNFSSSASSSSCSDTLSSRISNPGSTKTTSTINISMDEREDLAKVQNILESIDFSWIDALDQIFEANDYIKENCLNIMSLSQCMSTDKEELQVACKNLQNTLEIKTINNEEPPAVTPTKCGTDIVESNAILVDKEILKKPKSVAPNYPTIPAQTNISSDFLNLDDDVISLYAESLAALDQNTALAKKQIAAPVKPIQVGNVKPTVKTMITHTVTKPSVLTPADISSTVVYPDLRDNILNMNVRNPKPTEKVICEKQRADSTSVFRDSKCTDSETNSYCDPQESSVIALSPRKQLVVRGNQRNDWTSDEFPCSTIPNRVTAQPDRYMPKKAPMASINTKLSTIVFTGVCFKNLTYSCKNRNCQYVHRILTPEDISSRLSVVGPEICIQSYLIVKQYKPLCDRYLKVFIKMFGARKLSDLLFEIMLDITCDKIVTDQFDCMLMCLDELNTIDITGCKDTFLHTLPDQTFFSEVIVLFILRSGYFLRYIPVLSQLITLFYDRNIPLQTETVNQFVTVICATEMDVVQKDFLKLVYKQCIKNTQTSIFSTVPLADWDNFGKHLLQVNLEAEFEDLWSQIHPVLYDHKPSFVTEPCIQRPHPDSAMPAAVEPNLLNLNRLKEGNDLVKPQFVRNYTSQRAVFFQGRYGASGPRIEPRPPQMKWSKGGPNRKFRKNIQPRARFVTFGEAPRPFNVFAPSGSSAL